MEASNVGHSFLPPEFFTSHFFHSKQAGWLQRQNENPAKLWEQKTKARLRGANGEERTEIGRTEMLGKKSTRRQQRSLGMMQSLR
jgi:hypothetical protein